jgi:hypothetical protein
MGATLFDVNYREQPHLRCCINCRHCVLSGGEWCCRLTAMWQWVREACICDKYEHQTESEEVEQ